MDARYCHSKYPPFSDTVAHTLGPSDRCVRDLARVLLIKLSLRILEVRVLLVNACAIPVLFRTQTH
eukprot:29474-Eustigmatos_ZCMA.PRE.1